LKKIYLIGSTLILSMALFGCSTTSDNVENVNEGATKEDEEQVINKDSTKEEANQTINQEENKNQPNSQDVVEEVESDTVLNTGSTETVIRKIEGMEQEVKVINYQIAPYNISYQLDEVFGVPELNQNQIIYSNQNNTTKITLEIIEHTNLKKTVPSLQERFETEGYEKKGELESTPSEENGLRGKMQFFAYPVKGFYAYEINEHVLVITYEYSGEAGDGMYPLLESLRKSIRKDNNSTCETAPKTLNWNGKKYSLETESTKSLEPATKLGYVECSNDKFIVSKGDKNSMIVYAVGTANHRNEIIIIGKWGRALYSPVKGEEQSIYPKSFLNKVESELLNNHEELTSRVEKIHDYVGIEYDEDELKKMAQHSKCNELNSAIKQFVQEKLYEKVERTEKIGENAVMVITKDNYVFKLILQYNEEYEVWLVNAVGAL
jgi:hypothetical protein